MTGREVMRREELERPYRHPYRVMVGGTAREPAFRQAVARLAILPAVLTALVGLADPGAALPTAAVAAAFVLLCALLLLARTTLQVHAITRRWDARTELEDVRRRRPHAAEADPGTAHHEFAVTVEDDGVLAVWRLRPLALGVQAAGDEVLVLGRPCYAATVVEEHPFDPHDAAHAAEQLAEAQARAAELEQRAIEAAHRRLGEAEAADVLALETSSTAAALQHLTGQRRERP